jgi:prophage antirepressor-like protein
MKENKLETITNLFEGREIRCIWDSRKEDYYFSVVDVISALTNSPEPRKYWSVMKNRLKKEGSELTTNCSQLKLKSSDGKYYNQDVLDTEGIFRLIESVPSPNAEPFKLWLAKLGRQEVDNIFDPSKGIDKMIDYYLKKGYTLEWIEARIKAIISRKKLTKIWNKSGIEDNMEYAILTNEIYKEWSGMTSSEYKNYKGIRKESLRDNMTDIEVVLTDLGEIATRELTKEHKPLGLNENKKIAKMGGNVSKVARDDIEKKLGKSIVSNTNSLGYKYEKDNFKIEHK